MASTLFFLHFRPSPSSSSKPLPTTQIRTKNLITHYRCGHSHTTTTRETIQTHNLDRWFRLSTWKTQTQTTTKLDPSSCLQCKKRLASELRQAADIQRVIRLDAERASWKEGRRDPAPPMRGVQETIDAVLSLERDESVQRLKKLQENVLRGESASFSFKGMLPGEDDGNEMNPWERQRVFGMIAQKKLDAVARVTSSGILSGDGSVMNETSGDMTKSMHTRRSWSLGTWSLASIDEPEEQMQASSSHQQDQNSLIGERLSIDLSVRNLADNSSPELEKDVADHDARVSEIRTTDNTPGHQISALRNDAPRGQSQD